MFKTQSTTSNKRIYAKRLLCFISLTGAFILSISCSGAIVENNDVDASIYDGGLDANTQLVLPQIADNVEYLPYSEYYIGAADLIISDRDIVIDTDAMTIDGVRYAESRDPGPIVFDWYWVHKGDMNSIAKLAILHVRDFFVSEGVTVRCTGRKPLLVLGDKITINGIIDASARGTEAGCGGRGLGGGYGNSALGELMYGRNGKRFPPSSICPGSNNPLDHEFDAGGGGAGHLTPGGAGGQTPCGKNGFTEGGQASDSFSDGAIIRMIGGSGGGRGTSWISSSMPGACPGGEGGAGGGGVSLYAQTKIALGARGGIGVGGGGGRGGIATGSCLNTTAGGGGGSGGTIILKSTDITVEGTLVANGGGGGGGADSVESNGVSGGDGEDGHMSTIAALGGAPATAEQGRGGNGGALASQSGGSGNDGTHNAGGGGGGVGRILISTAKQGIYREVNAVFSPLPFVRVHTPGDAPKQSSAPGRR